MKKLKKVLSASLYIMVILVVTFVLVRFVGQSIEVDGSSMEPTLKNGDRLIIDKITYMKEEPKRFDVVVFPYSGKAGTYYIKRIIGLPGEKVLIDDNGVIYINDEELNEDYGMEKIEDPGLAKNGIFLSDNEYFVLGDNRNDSADSRFVSVGNIRRKQIMGKAWIRILPLKRIGGVK